MRSKVVWTAIILFLCAGLLRSAPQETNSAADGKGKEAGRLIRLHLLDKPPASHVRALRNIFILERTAEEGIPASALKPPISKRDAPETGPAERPEIRYVGYVTTAGKAVGLIFSGGEAQSVSEGDTIPGGYIVRKIGPEVLELEAPDGQLITVSIEGAR